MCDWCRESIPASTSVTDMNGTLKFCSFLCLNKYKMNLFCTEAQQHLPQLQKEMLLSSPVNEKNPDKKMLITPELWLSDGNSSDHIHSETRKRQKLNKETEDKYKSNEIISKFTSKFLPKHQNTSSDDRDFPRNDFPLGKSKCSSNTNHVKKKHKVSSNDANNRNSRDINFLQNGDHKHFHSDADFQKGFQHTKLMFKPREINQENGHPKLNTLLGQDGTRTDQNNLLTNPSNFPFLFLPPWLNGQPTNHNLSNFLQQPLFSSSLNPQVHNFLNSSLPTFSPPQNLSTQRQETRGLLPPSTTMVPYPFLLPIPIPIPIPIIINKNSKHDNLKQASSEADKKEQSHQNNEDRKSVLQDRVCNHDDDDNLTQNNLNQAIDFSLNRSNSRGKSVTPMDLNPANPPMDLNPPNSPHIPLNSLMKIKTEPEEVSSLQLSDNLPLNNEARLSYAARRSLILDAPPQPQTKSNSTYNSLQGPKRFTQNRKRCISVHIKTK